MISLSDRFAHLLDEVAPPRGGAFPSRPAGESLAPLPPGSAVGSFVVRGVAGSDEFGICYRAASSASDNEVLIDEYAPAALGQRAPDGGIVPRSPALAALWSEGLQAFVQEAEQFSRLAHPALLRIGAVWAARGTAYRLRAGSEGRPLADMLDAMGGVPVPEAWVRRLLLPLLGALETVHAAGWVHGNVRPAQIALRADGMPLLLDSGAVRLLLSPRLPVPVAPVQSEFLPVELTDPSTPLPVGPWSDLYSLASLARWCLTGEAPAPSEDRRDRSRARGGLLTVLELTLAADPAERPQSAAEFRHALEVAAAAEAESASDAARWPAAANPRAPRAEPPFADATTEPAFGAEDEQPFPRARAAPGTAAPAPTAPAVYYDAAQAIPGPAHAQARPEAHEPAPAPSGVVGTEGGQPAMERDSPYSSAGAFGAAGSSPGPSLLFDVGARAASAPGATRGLAPLVGSTREPAWTPHDASFGAAAASSATHPFAASSAAGGRHGDLAGSAAGSIRFAPIAPRADGAGGAGRAFTRRPASRWPAVLGGAAVGVALTVVLMGVVLRPTADVRLTLDAPNPAPLAAAPLPANAPVAGGTSPTGERSLAASEAAAGAVGPASSVAEPLRSAAGAAASPDASLAAAAERGQATGDDPSTPATAMQEARAPQASAGAEVETILEMSERTQGSTQESTQESTQQGPQQSSRQRPPERDTTPSARTRADPPADAPLPTDAARRQAEAPANATPAGACAPRSNFSLYRCMQTQCEQRRFFAHPQCIRLRVSDEVS